MGSATIKYAAVRRDFADVEIVINRGFVDTGVIYRGERIGTLPTRAALEEGAVYPLSDGGSLSVSMPKGRFPPQVVLNGTALRMTQDPPGVVRNAANFLLAVGILQLVVLSVLVLSRIAEVNGFALLAIVWGAAYVLLSFPIRKGSSVTTYFAIALLLVDLCYYAATMSSDGPVLVKIGGVGLRLIGLKALFHGVAAISKIRMREAGKLADANVDAV